MDDFSKNQLSRLLEAGVIEAEAAANLGDEPVGADSSAQARLKSPITSRPKKWLKNNALLLTA
jgi:hypothetical protein